MPLEKGEMEIAGSAGIEPTSKVLETSILPLNYEPRKQRTFADYNK